MTLSNDRYMNLNHQTKPKKIFFIISRSEFNKQGIEGKY